MSTEAPTTTFADFVARAIKNKSTMDNEERERWLVKGQEEYDRNAEVVKRVGIKDWFDEAARKHKELTGRDARVDLSPRPALVTHDLIPNYQVIEGSSSYEIMFVWEPPGTMGVERSIGVRVNNDRLSVISSNFADPRIPIYEARADVLLVKALMEVYENPLENGKRRG